MKDLRPIRGRKYILDQIALGEHEQQDFKYAISDARKIARSLSAFANCKGGHLLVGVKDNGVIAGVRNEEDIFVIEQAAELYCDPPQEIDFTAFNTGESGIVIRARIAAAAQRPVCAQEPDLSWRAYYRVADENIAAHPLMVRAWRMQASEQSALMSLDGVESALMGAIAERGSVSIPDALLLVPASRRTVEAAIVRLASLGLITFAHHPRHGFRLTIA